ncbi:MAG: M20/M25/M40 family metallo-hydrolase [Gemmatimonadales bacterium]
MRWLCLLLILTGRPLAAQTATPLSRAAETITEDDVMRRVGIIAADSMMGRGTPSPGLERTAEYVAAEFERAGLRPAGENGSYLQRFGVTRWTLDTGRSFVEIRANGERQVARVGTDARYVLGTIPGQPVQGSTVLLAGLDLPTASVGAGVKDLIVLLVVDFSRPVPPTLNERIVDLARAGPKAVVILSNRDSVTFARRLSAASRPRLTRDLDQLTSEGAPVVEVQERSLTAVLAAAGIDPSQLRRTELLYRRPIPGLTIELNLARTIVARGMVPNVAGILEGSDPRMRHEYLIYSAHIDHIGISPGQRDSINNGADDNASGVAGLLELVEAFTQPGVRPKRSLLFLAPSGEEDGLLGSAHFTEHPTVPLHQVVANLNMDLLGRNWRDSVIAVGLEQSDLGPTLGRVVQAHPELRMTPIADRWPEERIFYRSDHYNFARKGVPILFFTSGTHADYHQPSDEPQTIDGEKEARLVRLLFYLGATVADQVSRPRWTAESYRQIVGRR